MTGVGARVHEHADRHTRLVPADELSRITRILHEPERDVDARRLLLNQIQQDGATVFAGGIAEVVSARRGRREHTNGDENAQQSRAHTYSPAATSQVGAGDSPTARVMPALIWKSGNPEIWELEI